MPDYKELASKQFEVWQPLFDRHKADADFFNMVSKTDKLLDADNKEIPHSVHVLLNDIAAFTWEVETELNAADEQVAVTSKNKRFDTAYVENYIKAAFNGADELLTLKGMYPFDPFIDQQTFRRGSVASFCNFHIENKELIPNITPWDTGFFVIKNDSKGIYYTATKFYRSIDQIIAEHPEAEGKVKGDENIEVLYLVAKDVNELWIGGELIKGIPNRLGYVPVVYHRVPMGSMLSDQNTIQFQGESGIFLIRLLFVELERIMSIIQSLNLKAVDQALQLPVPREERALPGQPGKTVDELVAPGAVNETPEGSRYELMPLGQLQAMADKLIQMIQERMQRGTSQTYRNIVNPPTATQIMMEAEERGNVILPRIGTRGLLKQDLARMIIKQTIDSAQKAKVQSVKLDGEEWEVSKLKGDYKIEYKYHFTDPRLDAARQSMATAQRGQRPEAWILRNTLMSEDPEGEERQLAVEKARVLSPLAELDWTITKLLEDADEGNPYAEDQAMALAMVWIPAAKQAMQGLLTPNMPEALKPAQPMIPLLPGESQGGQ